MNHPFHKNELVITDHIQDWPDYPPVPVFQTPVPLRQGFRSIFEKKPLWVPTIADFQYFCPSVLPDVVARGAVQEGTIFPEEKFGGPDMFGVPWVYEPLAGGSIEKSGFILFDDANDWKDKLVLPDLGSWDWDASARMNEKYLNTGRANILRLFSGCWFERLISFMGFENAAMALIDEDQQDAVLDLFETVTDVHCHLIDIACSVYKLDGFNVHDDWGAQKSPFFSFNIGKKMIVPSMRKLTDHIHSKGMIADLHSCGMIGKHIENFISAGWDCWAPQPINPVEEYYQRYGDKIVIEVIPEPFDWETTSEEAQRNAARIFFNAHNDPKKPCKIGYYGTDNLTPAFCEELYKISRMHYSNEDSV